MTDANSDHRRPAGPGDVGALLDAAINRFDRALRTLTGGLNAQRASPAADVQEAALDEAQRKHAAGLMRVNHTGEACAQALYEGQAMTARNEQVRARLLAAAAEESDHLAWCAERLEQLQARPSVLNPLFYAASYALGAAAGLIGDRVSLGFVEATEAQVCEHLDRHLEALPEQDERSRAIVATMRDEEARHGATALASGGAEFPKPVKEAMTLASRLMTESAYRI